MKGLKELKLLVSNETEAGGCGKLIALTIGDSLFHIRLH
jgi:hypothetical protein